MSELDFSPLGGASRPQEGRSRIVRASIDALNSHEFQKMNRILEQDYTQKQQTILDQPLGVVINNTANFFGKFLEKVWGRFWAGSCWDFGEIILSNWV